MSLTNPPQAILTDVFGTVVDWRTTVTNYLTNTASSALSDPSKSLPSTTRSAASTISWPSFAAAWRYSYYKFVSTYDPETMPFKNIDEHHCEALTSLLAEHSVSDLYTDKEIREMSLIWHFLDPWPDSSSGLGLLNQKVSTATLSNGNQSLLSDLASHGSLPYTHIISAEDFKAYKPHPSVYLGAAKKLGLKPEECALVAAHLGDLQAAKKCGFQAIYIDRPQEESWKKEMVEEARGSGWVDMWVEQGEGGFLEVARRFGIEEKAKM
jgi:2-haloacid dehalogenase